MRILALETSSKEASVALADGRGALVERSLNPNEGTARTLAPAVQEVLAEADCSPQQVELVAVAVGPGSFTGLRVGVTLAKAFAYAAGCEVLGVNTLEAIAERAPGDVDELETVINAYRGQLFAARWTRDERGWTESRPTDAVDTDDWLKLLHPGVPLSGPGLARIQDQLPEGLRLIDEQFWRPTAVATAAIARRRFEAGERSDVWKLSPQYYRPSAAEEKKNNQAPAEG